jgi:hypothetical protein
MAKTLRYVFHGEFLVGVSDMPFLERGYYITLLCMQHQKGHLSEETICFALGLRSVSEIPSVMSHFKVDDDGKYYQGRMEIETEKRRKYTESRIENGKKGGRPKKKKQIHMDNHMDNHMGTHMGNGNRDENRDDIKAIVSYLNEVAGTKYKANSKVTVSHIQSRLKEGFT